MKDNDFMKKVASALVRNRNKRAFDRSMMHPEREWFLGIFTLIIVVAASAFWNIIKYQDFSRVTVETVDGSVGTGVYNGGMVFSALNELEENEREYTEIKNSIINRQAPISSPQVEVESPEEDATATTSDVEDVETAIETESTESETEPEVVEVVPELGV